MKKFMFLAVAIVVIANFCFAQTQNFLEKNLCYDTIFFPKGKIERIDVYCKLPFLSENQIKKIEKKVKKRNFDSKDIFIARFREKNYWAIYIFIKENNVIFQIRGNDGSLRCCFKQNNLEHIFFSETNCQVGDYDCIRKHLKEQEWYQLIIYQEELFKIIDKL